MTIVIPVWDGRISPVLDVAGRFLVLGFERGREVSRREWVVGRCQPGSMVKAIQEMRGDVLLCGAISSEIADGLARAGVHVLPHLCGEIEAVVQAFLLNKMDRKEFRMPGCCLRLCGCQKAWRHRRCIPGSRPSKTKR